MEPVPLDRNAAVDNVFVHPTVLEEFVGMMDVEGVPVAPAHLPKPVPTVFVLELRAPTVAPEHVDPTVLEAIVVFAQLARDVVLDNANATMIVTKEIVEMPTNLMEPTLVCAHKEPVEHAPLVSLVEAMDDVLPQHHVMSSLLLLIVVLELL